MDKNINTANMPSVLALAYLGDARHSLYIRKMLVAMGISKPKDLNRVSLEYVTAEAQALHYEKIKHLLTEDELGVFKRAFNSSHLNKPKRASGKDYRTATGFEAVLGMLEYIGDTDRIEYLLSYNNDNRKDDENDTED